MCQGAKMELEKLTDKTDSEDSTAVEIDDVFSENQPNEKKKKWSKKKSLIFWSLGGAISITAGIGLGIVLATIFNGGGTGNYDNIDTSKYAVDYDQLIKRFESTNTSDYSTVFTPCEMANIALKKFYDADSWIAQGYGSGSAQVMMVNVDQQIRSTFIKKDNEYFEESLSKSSVVKAAWRMYETYENADSEVTRYQGTVEKDVYDSFFKEADKSVWTREQYKEKAGRYLDGMPFIYIVSDLCLAKEDQKVTSSTPTGVKKTSSGYTIELELDPSITVKNYVVQMQATADLAGPPVFRFVHLTFKTDSKLNLISSTNYEKYYAKTSAGAGSNVIGNVTTYYQTGGEITIPKINEQTQYDKSKE